MTSRRSGEILRKLTSQLRQKYGQEAQSLAMLLLEDIFDLSLNDTLLDSPVEISKTATEKLDEYIRMLLHDVPIQHILGQADFYGYRFKVNNQVLIPRQETEELVQAVSQLISSQKYTTMLDVGTGSGCIAIAIALEHPALKVTALDISPAAITIAEENANALGARITFKQADILRNNIAGQFDVVVSNPPYIKEAEKPFIPTNVLHYEPSTALFVPDDQPLIFYERIAGQAKKQLNRNGLLFFEINERLGQETIAVLQKYDFTDIELRNDLNNKPRFVFGFKK